MGPVEYKAPNVTAYLKETTIHRFKTIPFFSFISFLIIFSFSSFLRVFSLIRSFFLSSFFLYLIFLRCLSFNHCSLLLFILSLFPLFLFIYYFFIISFISLFFLPSFISMIQSFILLSFSLPFKKHFKNSFLPSSFHLLILLLIPSFYLFLSLCNSCLLSILSFSFP